AVRGSGPRRPQARPSHGRRPGGLPARGDERHRAARLLRSDAQLSRLSMVLMTGFPPEQLRAGLRCRILGKPFGLEQVLEALTLALSRGHMPLLPVPARLLAGSA